VGDQLRKCRISLAHTAQGRAGQGSREESPRPI
jgi:hypothetical protein